MSEKRVLVVDDDRSHSAAVASILSPLGYEIDVAEDGRSALHFVHRRPFALAILDYQMPGMDGIELFQQIQHVQPDVKGVLLTAYTTIDKVFPAIESGIERVLAKPVNAVELVDVVQHYVGPPPTGERSPEQAGQQKPGGKTT